MAHIDYEHSPREVRALVSLRWRESAACRQLCPLLSGLTLCLALLYALGLAARAPWRALILASVTMSVAIGGREGPLTRLFRVAGEWLYREHLDLSPRLPLGPTRLELSAEGITLRCRSLEHQWPWAALIRVRESRDLLTLSLQRGPTIAIGAQALGDEARDFLALLREKCRVESIPWLFGE